MLDRIRVMHYGNFEVLHVPIVGLLGCSGGSLTGLSAQELARGTEETHFNGTYGALLGGEVMLCSNCVGVELIVVVVGYNTRVKTKDGLDRLLYML